MDGIIKLGGPTYKRRPAMRGTVMLDVSMGKERVRAWPRARGKAKTPEAKKLQDSFRQANWACKYWDPRNIVSVDQLRKGTPVLIRDVQIMMMYNRFANFSLVDGTRIFSVQARQDVSDSLDTISPLPGSLLFRQADGWRYIPAPTEDGQALVGTASGEASWGSIAAGGNANWWFKNRPLAASLPTVVGPTGQVQTTDDADCGLVVDLGTPAADTLCRGRFLTVPAPAANWSVTVRITPMMGIDNFSWSGLWCVNRTVGRGMAFVRDNTGKMDMNRFTFPATVGATPFTSGLFGLNFDPFWLRVTKTATAFVFAISSTGKNFITVWSEPRATFMAADVLEVGVGGLYLRTVGDHIYTTCDYFVHSW